MQQTTGLDPVVALYFKVVVDGYDLGTFLSCEGLAVDVDIKEVSEGGNNGFAWKLPGRTSYSNIRFSRPLGRQSGKVAGWIARMGTGIKPGTGSITAMDYNDKPLFSWNLEGVVPVRWEGPQFSVDSAKVATETLEIAHHGFALK